MLKEIVVDNACQTMRHWTFYLDLLLLDHTVKDIPRLVTLSVLDD